ncbi:MAG: 7-cyano-7-deazaguanine synthase QueC [Methanosarcinales archaeon]|nr:7-cyano-7-deazaguanine synthase QueC [Methanosarcinales archaeon]
MNSVILLSAGLDSTVAFKHAYDQCEEVLCLTFDYGQQAAAKEMECAAKICSKFDATHEVIELPWIAHFGGALVGTSELPQIKKHELDSEKAVETARGVWVPARNLTFMAIAAGYAENYDYEFITVGLDFEEAKTFPDNTLEFVERFDRVLEYGTISNPKIDAPLIHMNKVDIIRLGILNGAPLELSWSCYKSGDVPCGVCESCLRRARAFAEVGVEDPGLTGAIAP